MSDRFRPHRPRRWPAAVLLVLSLLALRAAALPDSSEAGRPAFRNFRPTEYRGHPQIYGVTLGADGLLYATNEQGILQFDGLRWRHLPAPVSMVHGIATTPDGRIWVAGQDEVGRFEPGAEGIPVYRSLTARLPASVLPWGRCRSLFARGGEVFMAARRGIARWRGDEVRAWTLPGEFPPKVLLAGDVVYAVVKGEGLFRLEHDEFVRVSDAPEFRNATALLALDRDAARGVVRFVAGAAGAVAFDERSGAVTPLPAAFNEAAKGTRVWNGLALPDGRFALATDNQGVWIVAPDLASFVRLDRSTGLVDNAVLALAVDTQRGLWLGCNSGLARLEVDSPLTVFDSTNGLAPGTIDCWGRHQGVLYAGAFDGLFKLVPADPRAGKPARFERDPRRVTSLFAIESYEGEMLVAAAAGLFRLTPDSADLVGPSGENVPLCLVVSRAVPGRFYLGGIYGLTVVEKSAAGWRVVGANHELGDVHTALEEADGTLWLSSYSRGFWRLASPRDVTDWKNAPLTQYHRAHGLPAAYNWTSVAEGPFGTSFFTSEGSFRFDAARDVFVPEDRFRLEGRAGLAVFPLVLDARGDAWGSVLLPGQLAAAGALGRFPKSAAGVREFVAAPAAVLEETGFAGAAVMWREQTAQGEVLWARGYHNTVRLELGRETPSVAGWSARIRGLRDGTRDLALPPPGGAPLRLAYSRDPLVFSLAAPRFDLGGTLRFETRLVGFHDEWSEPSEQAEVRFTNLEGGPFVFEARARDAQGNVSAPASVEFLVDPPWYRMHSVLRLYVILGVALVIGYIRWRLHRLRRRARELEALVATRTTDLAKARDEAERASRAKSVFVAHMSHELRTPLNSILGYAQLLQKSPTIPAPDQERLRIVASSGEHLLRMINEVLDFSKIESGHLELKLAAFDLPALLRDLAAAHEPRARQKGLAFQLVVAAGVPGQVEGDAQKLRQVLENLLGNAIKFTAQGRVELRVERAEAGGLRFAVTDTGAGIAPEDQARLFTAFVQTGDDRGDEPGTGLGLAISRKLAQLMGGDLAVESALARGSTFTLNVPLKALALGPVATPSVRRDIVGYAGSRRWVLVVDDVAANRALLRDLLQPLGFLISEAADGAEALRRAHTEHPDVILLDLRMRGLDGFAVAKRLREEPHGEGRTVIIAMSASVLDVDFAQVKAAGFDAYVRKPFREEELLVPLGEFLGLKWLYRERASSTLGTAFRWPARGILEELLRAAQRGEVVVLREQLRALQTREPALASFVEAVGALVQQFQLERVEALLSEGLSAADGGGTSA